MAFQHYSDQDIPGGSISAWKHVIPALKSNFLLKLYYVCMYITYLSSTFVRNNLPMQVYESTPE